MAFCRDNLVYQWRLLRLAQCGICVGNRGVEIANWVLWHQTLSLAQINNLVTLWSAVYRVWHKAINVF